MKDKAVASTQSSLLIPNSFQVPNILVDKLFFALETSDIAIILFICRKTFGWQKMRDRISLSQFEKGTGLSRTCLISRLRILADSGLLGKENKKVGDIYWLIVDANLDKVAMFLEASRPKREPKKKRAGGSMVAPPTSTTIEPVQLLYQTSATVEPVSGTMVAPTETHTLKPTSQNPNTLPLAPLTGTIEVSGLAVDKVENTADPRWTPFLADLKAYWTYANPDVPMTFNGQVDGRAVKKFLTDNPQADQRIWKRCLYNFAESHVAHAEPVHRWLPTLMKYSESAFNEYGKPVKVNGKGAKQSQKEQEIHDHVSNSEEARRRIFGAGRGEVRPGGQVSGGGRPVLESAAGTSGIDRSVVPPG